MFHLPAAAAAAAAALESSSPVRNEQKVNAEQP